MSDYNTYTKGTEIGITGQFFDDEGNPANPTTVTAVVKKPDGTEIIMDSLVTNVGAGAYTVPYTGWDLGLYDYRMQGSGSLKAAGEGKFMVESAF